MSKNTGMGGNKRKKGKKQVQESQEYAQIIKILGEGRFECNCADGVIANGNIILVSLREFEPEKWNIVEKYKEKEVVN